MTLEGESPRFEDAALPASRTEPQATSHQPRTAGSLQMLEKAQGNGSLSLEPPEGTLPVPYLDFSPMRPILDLCPPEVEGNKGELQFMVKPGVPSTCFFSLPE